MSTIGVIFIIASLTALSASSLVAWLAAGWTDNRGLRAFTIFLFCLIGMGLTAFLPGAMIRAGTPLQKILSYAFETISISIFPILAFGIIERRIPGWFLAPYLAVCAVLAVAKTVISLFFLTQMAQTLIATFDTLIAAGFFAFIVISRNSITNAATRRIVFRFTVVASVFTPFLFYNCIGIPGFTPFLNAYITEACFFFAVSIVVLAESRSWLAELATRNAAATRIQDVRSDGAGSDETNDSDRQSAVNLYAELSPRQREIADMIVAGSSAKEIAAELGISPKTAENHTYALYRKFGARSRIQFYEMMRANTDQRG
jgi:DNA-binding CsgD family transcriptional regulator